MMAKMTVKVMTIMMIIMMITMTTILKTIMVIIAITTMTIRVEEITVLHLNEMVLNDVPNDAVLVEVSTTALRAKVFTEDDLHVTDVGAVPQGLEDEVCKPQDGQVLDQLLSEVVVDPEDLLLRQMLL